MTTTRTLRNITVLTLVFLIFSMPLLTQAQENDQALKSIPDKALFCLRINNLNNSLSQLDQFLAGVAPVNLSGMVMQLLPGILGSPELAGLNMDGSITAFGTLASNPESQSIGDINIFAGILVPVTNYQAFIDGIANKTPADDNGVVKLTLLKNVLVTQLNNYALVTWESNYDKLISYKKAMNNSSAKPARLSSVLDSAQAKQATTEPVWIYGNIEQAAKTFGPMITAGLQTVKTMASSLPSSETGIEPAEMQNIMDMYFSLIDTVMKETKSVSISINPTPNALNITKIVDTIPGSKMAKMFSLSSSKSQNDLLAYLEDGSMMNFAFSMDSPIWKESIDLQMDLISMLGGDAVSKEAIDKMKSLSQEVLNYTSGYAVYTFSEDNDINPPFKGKYIIGVKDEKKFQQVINKASELINSTEFLGIYKNMGIDFQYKVERNVETYKGVSIDSAIFSMKFDESNNQQAQMIEEIYGDGFEYRWGVTNGLFAATIGSDADQTIHELIDIIQSGQAKQICSETQAAISLLPGAEKADFFFTMNILRLMKLGMNMAGSVLPISLPPLDNIQTNSNIVVTGNSDNGKMTIKLALPKEHIQEIMNAIMTMQMMQSQPAARL